MTFAKEADFEDALIEALSRKGWEEKVIEYPSEEDLLKNWAAILFDNNRQEDRLGDHPLTDSEMRQILEQIAALRSPLKLSGFINGKTVSIRRDNPEDRLHFGKEVSLKIYDRRDDWSSNHQIRPSAASSRRMAGGSSEISPCRPVPRSGGASSAVR